MAARLVADHAYIDALRQGEEPVDAPLGPHADWLSGPHQSNLGSRAVSFGRLGDVGFEVAGLQALERARPGTQAQECLKRRESPRIRGYRCIRHERPGAKNSCKSRTSGAEIQTRAAGSHPGGRGFESP